MARWRLTASHYINVPNNNWEQIETDRMTARQVRKAYPVPRIFDIKDVNDWTNVIRNPRGEALDGEIIVCHEGKGEPSDAVFIGDPSPYMEPLDDEAKAISATFEGKWNHPIDSLSGNFDQSLINRFEQQMADLVKGAAVQNTPVVDVTKEEFNELKSQIMELMRQNTMLVEKVVKDSGRRA